MPLPSCASAVLAVALFAAASAGSVCAQVIEGLGHTHPFAMSYDGSVVVGVAYSASLGEYEVYRWKKSEPLRRIEGAIGTDAESVSGDGRVVLGSAKADEDDLFGTAFKWTDGAMTLLPALNFAGRANYDGSVIAGGKRNDDGDWDVVVDGGANFGVGLVTGIDSAGANIVGYSIVDHVARARIWPAGTDLGEGMARAISPDGNTVIGSRPDGTSFRWTRSGGIDLLIPGYVSDMTRDGATIVGSESGVPFIWTETDGAQPLDVFLSERGVALEGWQLHGARLISEDGNVLVGNGINPQGEPEGWRIELSRALVTDLRFSGGFIRADPFEGASARLSRGNIPLELVLTDSAGAYAFGETDETGGYELRISDHNTWGIQRAWTDLSKGGIYKSVRLPATLMTQLAAMSDTLATRHYGSGAVRDLFRPYEHWADTTHTDVAEVDTALARLIITHEALRAMYDNTVPVSKELATAMAELMGFAVATLQSMKSNNMPLANQNLSLESASKFQRQVDSFAATTIFNLVTNAIMSVLPSSPAVLKAGLVEARAVILAQMQAELTGTGFNAGAVLRGAAVRVGAAVGDDLLMKLYQSITQEDLDQAAQRADAFAFSGEPHASWQAATEKGNTNAADSDDAASFSELTRSSASTIGGITGLAGGFTRTVRLAQVLRVVQLSGYVSAIARTSWQFYDTAENDLPHAIDLAFDPVASPESAPNIQLEPDTRELALGSGRHSVVVANDELEQAISRYLQEVDGLVALAQNGNEAVFAEQLMALLDAADAIASAVARAHLPVLATASQARASIEDFDDAHAELLEAVIAGATHHLALSAYALGYLGEDASADELAAQADTVHAAFEGIAPKLVAVSTLVAELPVPAFVVVTRHEQSVDSVEAGQSFKLRATIRNGGSTPAESVVVRLVPDLNMEVNGPTTIEVGDMAGADERTLEWTVAAHDTATSSAYQILIEPANAEGLPFASSFAVAGATSVDAERNQAQDLPHRIALEQNYPNPFNSSTTIRYVVRTAGYVRLEVFDTLGRRVARLVDQGQPAGRHEVTFTAGQLPSGSYLYKLQSTGIVSSKVMVLAK